MASIVSRQTFTPAASTAPRGHGSWRRAFIAWLTSQSDLRRQWDRSGISTSGRRVPYRVWARHGAYLQMQRHNHDH